jgi:hypothetical protein
MSGIHLGQATNYSFSLRFSLDSCGFVNKRKSHPHQDVTVFICPISFLGGGSVDTLTRQWMHT